MKIAMLIDDKKTNTSLKTEHGLAIYIESKDKKILFDTGATGSFMDNAISMGIDLKAVDIVILSHAHKDHSGGLPKFLELNKQAKVFMSHKVMQQYYIKALCVKKNISAPAEIFTKYQKRLYLLENFTAVSDTSFVVMNFIKKYPPLKSSKNLLVKNEGEFIPDPFEHELALVINYEGKLVIICGCSHNGIENMIETVMKYFPELPIEMVIGGFHLMDFPQNLVQESKEDISKIGQRLGNYNMNKIYTCHCTGRRSFAILKEVLGNKIEYFYTGMELEL